MSWTGRCIGRGLLLHISEGCTSCTSHIANALAGNLRKTMEDLGTLQHRLKTQVAQDQCCSAFALPQLNQLDSSTDIAVGSFFALKVWAPNIHHCTVISVLPAVDIDLDRTAFPLQRAHLLQHSLGLFGLCFVSYKMYPKIS